MKNQQWTHSELVERAVRWLRNSAIVPSAETAAGKLKVRCGVVLAEPQGEAENPDAIGWFNRGRHSVLIECKSSLSDYMADRRKWSRRAGEQYGLGRFRYYMATPGIIHAVAKFHVYGWGLLAVHGRSVKVIKPSREFNCNKNAELQLIYSGLRAAQLAEKTDRRMSRCLMEAAPEMLELLKEWIVMGGVSTEVKTVQFLKSLGE